MKPEWDFKLIKTKKVFSKSETSQKKTCRYLTDRLTTQNRKIMKNSLSCITNFKINITENKNQVIFQKYLTNLSIFDKFMPMRYFPKAGRYLHPLLLFSLSVILLSGCYTPRYTEAEILFPGKQEIPEEVDTIAMINRSYLPHHERSKTGIRYEHNRYVREDEYLDSIVSDNALYSLAYHLNEGPRLTVSHQDSIVRIPVSEYDYLSAMESGKVSELCQEMHADAVVALETFHSFDSLSYDASVFEVFAHRTTNLITVWRMYTPDHIRPIQKSLFKDTLYFRASGYSAYTSKQNLPTRRQALYEASFQAGKKLAHNISPHWKGIERIYFEYFNEPMSKAATYARNKEWKQAAAIWRSVAEEGDRRKHALAAYNMAVASEMTGNLELASYWLAEALEKKPNDYYFKKYRDILSKRIERQKTIDRQMGVSD